MKKLRQENLNRHKMLLHLQYKKKIVAQKIIIELKHHFMISKNKKSLSLQENFQILKYQKLKFKRQLKEGW